MLVEVLYLLVNEKSFNFGWQNLVVPNVKQSWTNNGARFYQRDAGKTWETHDGHEYIHILAQINVSLWLKWKKIVLLFICSHSGLRHKIKNISHLQHVQILNKGGKFLENCGGALVGEDNKIILISSTVDNVY